MRNSKHGLKALVMGMMVVLGAMVFAAGAQAQGPHFELLHLELLKAASLLTHEALLLKEIKHNAPGGPLNPNALLDGGTLGTFSVNLGPIGTLKVPLAAKQIGIGVLLVAERSIEIRCTGLTLKEANIDTSTDALGEAIFTGCHTYDHKALTLLKNCELKELLTIKAKALVLPVLHGPVGKELLFLLFEPQEVGKSFTTISYKPGIGCTLPLNNPVTGSVVALVEQLEGAKLGILFSEGIQLLLGDKLAFGGFPSYISATGEVSPSNAGHTKIGVH